jgi:hypothetical protein
MKNGFFGHASNDARTAFCQAVVDYSDKVGRDRRCNLPAQHRKAFTSLWNCPDILPGDIADLVMELSEMRGTPRPKRSTYGAAARAMCS